MFGPREETILGRMASSAGKVGEPAEDCELLAIGSQLLQIGRERVGRACLTWEKGCWDHSQVIGYQ